MGRIDRHPSAHGELNKIANEVLLRVRVRIRVRVRVKVRLGLAILQSPLRALLH